MVELPHTRLHWAAGTIVLTFSLDDGPVKLVDIELVGVELLRSARRAEARQPLVELSTPGFGHGGDESKLIQTPIGSRLRYHSHVEGLEHDVASLVIEQHDSTTGLVVRSHFEVTGRAPAVRTYTSVALGADRVAVRLLHVTTLATGAVISDSIADLDVWSGASSPRAEARWSSSPLRSPGLIAMDGNERGELSWSGTQVSNFGSRSSLAAVPAGALADRKRQTSFAWQVEHNGTWTWEVGELADRARGIIPPEDRVRHPEPAAVMQGDSSNDGAYIAVVGPTDVRGSWSHVLHPGDEFQTVAATFSVGASIDDALGNLTRYRRASRRIHVQNETLPVIFNDYMNTLVGDPTEEKLLPLIDAAAAVGAEYFCIDAGWYDDGAGWWESVGDWRASTERFPSGIQSLFDHMRVRGMVPGLWLEPEVVGITSRAATELPDEAFITRDGVRVMVNNRYFLDMRNEVALHHLDSTVDRLVGDYGVGYFKFDYNVTPGVGPDLDADSVGDGLLAHNRAVLAWFRSLLDRHAELVIESCSGGGGRTDFATLRELQLASTSDQENPLAYPHIAVGALAHILPEQAGNWAYPQADMSDHEIAFAMTSGLAGRLYLAGVLNRMNAHQLGLVRDAVDVHKETRNFIARSIPTFPLGFPDWKHAWTAVAFEAAEHSGAERLLMVWATLGASFSTELSLRTSETSPSRIDRIYPSGLVGGDWRVDAEGDQLTITRPAQLPSAAIFRLTYEGDHA